MPGGLTKKYPDEVKFAVLNSYIEAQRSIQAASDMHSVPYQTINTWLKKQWAKDYVKQYETKLREKITNHNLRVINDAKVESLVTDYNYNINANLILSMIEDKVIELIPKCKSIKELTPLYKVVSDIKLRLLGVKGESAGSADDEKRTIILNMIDKQMNVTPNFIRDLLPKK